MRKFVAILLLTVGAQSAFATETINYVYDEQGRLVQVSHSGGQTATYSYDKADNRVTTTVTGASH
jgi:YD repeat-containing protein